MRNEIRNLRGKVAFLHAFLFDVARGEKGAIADRLSRMAEWRRYERFCSIFEEFEANLLEVEGLSAAIDSSLHNQIVRLREESGLVEGLAQIHLQLKLIAADMGGRRPRSLFGRTLPFIPCISSLLPRHRRFSREHLSVHDVLVTLTRLKAIIRRLDKLSLQVESQRATPYAAATRDSEKLLEYLDRLVGMGKPGSDPEGQKH